MEESYWLCSLLVLFTWVFSVVQHVGRLLDGCHGLVPFELVNDGDSLAVIDARRNLSGVCGRWYPVLLDLHRFFIAISRAVVNHDGRDGTAFDPLVWSACALPKRRRLVLAVRDRAFLPGTLGIWDSESLQILATVICAEDIAHWPYTPGLLVKWVSFLGSLHWPAGGLDLGLVASLMLSCSFFISFGLAEALFGERLILVILNQGVQFQCRLFRFVQGIDISVLVVSLVQ